MLEFRDLQDSIASLTEHFFNNLNPPFQPFSDGTVANARQKISAVDRNSRCHRVNFDSPGCITLQPFNIVALSVFFLDLKIFCLNSRRRFFCGGIVFVLTCLVAK